MFDWVQNTTLEKKIFKVLTFLNPLIKLVTLIKEILKCKFHENWSTFQFRDQICPNEIWVNIINFFSIWVFLSRTFTNHRTAGEGAGHLLDSPLRLPTASQTLHQGITAESSPLHIASSRT